MAGPLAATGITITTLDHLTFRNFISENTKNTRENGHRDDTRDISRDTLVKDRCILYA